MNRDPAVAFANQLRSAREQALADSEAYDGIIHVVERLGMLLDGKIGTLGSYEGALLAESALSPLSQDVPLKFPDFHAPFERLYGHFRDARNDALHQGAFARRLTEHAIQLSIVMEDALRRSVANPTIGDYMVRNPVCAAEWQPLSFVRQQMLANSFSFLPLRRNGRWYLISDVQLASYLGSDPSERKHKMAETVGQAASAFGLEEAVPMPTSTPLNDAIELLRKSSHPVLVVGASGQDSDLVGIVTAFDLL